MVNQSHPQHSFHLPLQRKDALRIRLVANKKFIFNLNKNDFYVFSPNAAKYGPE